MNEQKTAYDPDDLRKAKQAAIDELLRPNGNILGVGIGKKLKDGKTTQQDCIRVYVVAKFDDEAPPFRRKDLSQAAVIPPKYGDVLTDVVEVTRFGREGSSPAPKAGAVLQPGSPIRVKTTAPNVNSGFRGTLGAVVTKQDDGEARYILSCNHVLYVNGRVSKDPKAAVVSAEFIGNEKEIAEPVANGFVPLDRGGGNSVDCAIARLRRDTRVATPPDFPKDTFDVDRLDLGTAVRKNGAVTGPRDGKIVDKDVDLYIDYSFGTFRFNHQILIDGESDDVEQAFATAGDSGSLVITGDGNPARAVGMIFAASGRYAVACRIDDVLKMLSVKLVV